MIQIHRPSQYLDYDEMNRQFRKQAYRGYLSERKNFSTDELQIEIQTYEGKSRFGKLIFRAFSDDDAMLRICASRQILRERLS